MPELKPRNFCRSCRQDFAGIGLFDDRRVGVHEYTFVEGLERGVEDGRRCLDLDEMEAKGWELNAAGRWTDRRDNERLRGLTHTRT